MPSHGSPAGRVGFLILSVAMLVAASVSQAQWVEFVDETATRLVSDPSLGVDDAEEKDYAWGDVDNDGDIDLVVVRKEPFTSPGKRANVLFMNENGVLVDRTADLATASNVSGDQGFLTPTNDRDVQLADVDGDSWLDIVTAVTISDGDSKAIGHPRIYMNLGENGQGDWLGFRYEQQRIPTMLSYTGQSGFNPRFCSVAVGDVTGDGKVDLWFGDYDSSGAGGFGQPSGADYNDRLLVNNGSGSFLDATTARFAGEITIPGSTNTPFQVSAFGAAGAIADMNGDGFEDIVKQTSLNDPLYVGIAYNSPDNEGFFDTYEVLYDNAPYFISVDDLNNDGLLDIVITDDGADRYLLNQGTDPVDGMADFASFNFSYDAASDDGFGSNSLIVDLNRDDWKDVLIADVDVDIGGCNRRMHVYRNLGGTPGGNVTLQEQTSGTGCSTNQGNPSSCIVASIPSNLLEGVHDVAVFDINGDGWEDMVLGRCNGTEVYINDPSFGVMFAYPLGLPFFVSPTSPPTFQVQLSGFGGETPMPASGRLFVSVAGGPFNPVSMTEIGPDLYEASFPTSTCGDTLDFFVSAKGITGSAYGDPPGVPLETFSAVSAVGTDVTLEDGLEGDTSGWTVVNDASLTAGGWEVAEPVGTITTGGEQAAPDEDAEASTSAVHAFVTQNGASGGTASAADVDGGPTDLISPVLDLAGTNAIISYSRWFYSSGDDELTVWVTSDGSIWELVETVSANSNSWQVSSFRVGDHVTPSATVQVRFRTGDNPNDSIAEAAIDLFRVEEFVCSTCILPGDCDDGVFCNGAEQCNAGICSTGPDPCPGQQCDEGTDSCVECTLDSHCDDGDFCNGVETCSGNTCVAGTDPCPGQLCDDVSDTCTGCLTDSECDDGLFCNGAEICSGGICLDSGDACGNRSCDEGSDVCSGPLSLQPLMGEPLAELTGDELDRFDIGRVEFDTVLTAPDGLGPTFNQNSCSSCHSKSVGGSGSITVTRFGFSDAKAGGFDPLVHLGGSLRQSQSLTPECAEEVPPEANITANRVTNSTLGGGLVEAIADTDIEALALGPPAGISGAVHWVPELETPGGPARVGRFGWKAQLATVLSFSADASLNEMGLTNRLLPDENAPNGDEGLLALCDTVPDPEDGPDSEGFHFIDRVTDFQRFTAAPPQTPRAGMSGEALFNATGCASCHLPSSRTADDPALEAALRDRSIQPYSDFLLHDMGGSADFIVQGGAGARELRTPPLWGLRVRDPMWHDGRVAGGTFEDRVLAAIALHDALDSEGTASAQAFAALSVPDQDAVVVFLDSLGRAEFDFDGDSDRDQDDFNQLAACFSGPGSVYTPDDLCSIGDIDQDGDVDDDDVALFLPEEDGDGDGVANGLDCSLFDANQWSRPSPAQQLLIVQGATDTFDWSAPADPGGVASLSYDLLRSSGPADFSAAACVESAGGDLTATDNAQPGPGAGVYYLVRSTNVCGENLGASSTGAERAGAVCF